MFNKAGFLRDNSVAARFLAVFVDTQVTIRSRNRSIHHNQAFSVFLHQRHVVPRNLFDLSVGEARQLLARAADTPRETLAASRNSRFMVFVSTFILLNSMQFGFHCRCN